MPDPIQGHPVNNLVEAVESFIKICNGTNENVDYSSRFTDDPPNTVERNLVCWMDDVLCDLFDD